MLTPGETVAITGTDWPAHKLLQAAVCGGGPLAVSSECDLTHAIGFGSADNGVVGCVVDRHRATGSLSLRDTRHPGEPECRRVPAGHHRGRCRPGRSRPRRSRPRPTVRVSDVQVVSQSSWKSWFGAAAPRELIVTVHNGGSAAVRPLLVAKWIDGSDNYVITSPNPKMLRRRRNRTADRALLPLDVRPRPVRCRGEGDGKPGSTTGSWTPHPPRHGGSTSSSSCWRWGSSSRWERSSVDARRAGRRDTSSAGYPG